MFGRNWEPAQATVVEKKEVWSIGGGGGGSRSAAGWHPGSGSGSEKPKAYEYVADVQPTGGGAAFRTVMSPPFDERKWHEPSVGDVVPARCDPKRKKAKFEYTE